MAITVFLADDNLIVREGVKALLELEDDLDVVGQGADYDELVAGADAMQPQVIVTDIRMPPNFSREGIEAAKEVRKRNPGTGVVILSQFDDPDYAVSLLSEGAAGYAYLLKDRVGEGNQLARAVREVAAGGSMLDPKIVEALTNPVRAEASLSAADEDLLQQVARGSLGQGDRRPAQDDAGRRQCSNRGAVRNAGGGSCQRPWRQPRSPQDVAAGDRRPQGTGRGAEPLSSRRRGRAGDRRRSSARSDRGVDRHGADVRHPRLHDDRRARRSERPRRPVARAPRRHEPCDPRRSRHGHAVRRRRRDGRVRCAGRQSDHADRAVAAADSDAAGATRR